MKVIIGNTTYKKLRSVSFAPETDLTGDSLPINEFEAEIYTTDKINIGQYAKLCDDMDNVWANYWITYAENIDKQTLRVKAKSPLAILSQVRLNAELWVGKSVTSAIAETMGNMPYTLDSSFSGMTLNGFVPTQESRARLQWICFAIGAYVKTFFNETIEILPIDITTTLIPMNKTFWKPSVTFNDYVTGIVAKTYNFTPGTPANTDKWVEDSQGNFYIVSEQTVTLTNPDVPSAAPQNTVNIEEMYLLNSDNVSAVLSHLSDLYFKRTEVDIDVIDNAEYMPGDKVIVYSDDDTIMDGFIEKCNFQFGLQARASMHMVPTEGVTGAILLIKYQYTTMKLGEMMYFFPVGYEYSVSNPYFDLLIGEHRNIYRPENEGATGTITDDGVTDIENYEIALDYINNILHIYSVDELEEEDGVVSIS